MRLKLFLMLFLGCSLTAFAQMGNSPYSRIAFGDINPEGTIYNLGMGGIGVSNMSQAYPAVINPALLARHSIMSFDGGVLGQLRNLRSPSQQENNMAANLNYANFVLPVSKYWSMGLGLRPYSFIDYLANTEERIPQTATIVRYRLKGVGGLSQVYWANGFKLYKGLSVGIQASYIFGQAVNENTASLLGNTQSYTVTAFERYNYSTISTRMGIAYRQKIHKDNVYINFGATTDLQANLRVIEYKALQRRTASDEVSSADTIADLRGNATMPARYALGVSLEKPFAYTFGIDYSVQDWTNFTDARPTLPMAKAQKIGVCLEWTPNVNSVSNYFSRVSYRLGGHYAQTPLLINGVQMEEYGASVGFSMPLGRSISSLNFAVSYTQRGNATESTLQEQVVRLLLGVTINDPQWFVKRKIN